MLTRGSPQIAQQRSNDWLGTEAGLQALNATLWLGLGEVAASIDDESRAILAHRDSIDPQTEPASLHSKPAQATKICFFPQNPHSSHK